MDKDRRQKIKVEVKKRIDKLWEDFLEDMAALGYDDPFVGQQIEFRNSKYCKSDMRSRLTLKVPPKDGKL